MAQTWGKPASWVDYSGEVNGEKVGIVTMGMRQEATGQKGS